MRPVQQQDMFYYLHLSTVITLFYVCIDATRTVLRNHTPINRFDGTVFSKVYHILKIVPAYDHGIGPIETLHARSRTTFHQCCSACIVLGVEREMQIT